MPVSVFNLRRSLNSISFLFFGYFLGFLFQFFQLLWRLLFYCLWSAVADGFSHRFEPQPNGGVKAELSFRPLFGPHYFFLLGLCNVRQLFWHLPGKWNQTKAEQNKKKAHFGTCCASLPFWWTAIVVVVIVIVVVGVVIIIAVAGHVGAAWVAPVAAPACGNCWGYCLVPLAACNLYEFQIVAFIYTCYASAASVCCGMQKQPSQAAATAALEWIISAVGRHQRRLRLRQRLQRFCCTAAVVVFVAVTATAAVYRWVLCAKWKWTRASGCCLSCCLGCLSFIQYLHRYTHMCACVCVCSICPVHVSIKAQQQSQGCTPQKQPPVGKINKISLYWWALHLNCCCVGALNDHTHTQSHTHTHTCV